MKRALLLGSILLFSTTAIAVSPSKENTVPRFVEPITPDLYDKNQVPCGPRDDILAQLEQKYGEKIVVRGIDYNGMMIETLSNAETLTWTMIMTKPSNPPLNSCIVDTGQHWYFNPLEIEGISL